MLQILQQTPNLELREGMIIDLDIEAFENSNKIQTNNRVGYSSICDYLLKKQVFR